jgi:hypothetical protein
VSLANCWAGRAEMGVTRSKGSRVIRSGTTVGTVLAELGEHQLTIRDYLRHSNLSVTNKYLQAASNTKRKAQARLVEAILPGVSAIRRKNRRNGCTFIAQLPKVPTCKLLKKMAGTTRLELATSAVTGQRSNQLNYVPSLF